jgi:hypothetical protein
VTRRGWSLEVHLGWVLAVALGLAVAVLLLLWPRPQGIDPARIYRACEQYASLDLSGWAAICRDVGYQQSVYNQPPATRPTGWPYTVRTIQPEDLDR